MKLRQALMTLSRQTPARAPRGTLPGQPGDAALLALSPLYRRSRALYLAAGGTFEASLVSSPRSLSSAILVENRIQYSALAAEYDWLSRDPGETRGREEKLQRLRSYVTSVFHEQSHRLLWRELPPPEDASPGDPRAISRYLNFAESLVIATDSALSDSLGPGRAKPYYFAGALYDPGTEVRRELRSRREYRNYLHAAAHAVWLNLEFYEPAHIPRALHALFPTLGAFNDRAARRASTLDAAFIAHTNLKWQKRHAAGARAALRRGREKDAPLVIPDSPLDHRTRYLAGERWFQKMGL